jgi:hypothetical protein
MKDEVVYSKSRMNARMGELEKSWDRDVVAREVGVKVTTSGRLLSWALARSKRPGCRGWLALTGLHSSTRIQHLLWTNRYGCHDVLIVYTHTKNESMRGKMPVDDC